MRSFLTVAAVSLFAGSAMAQQITSFNFDDKVVGGKNLSFSGGVPFSSAGDGFNVFQRGVSASIPFALADDSVSIFPPDTQGMVSESKTDAWFGVVDTINGDNAGPLSATWTFDISGAASVYMDISMAAMGDFEAADYFNFEVDLDGGGFTSVFTSSVDEAGASAYTMDGGAVVILNDPLLMNGQKLGHDFQILSSGLLGSGSTLTLRLTTVADGGAEGFAFDNIVLNSVPTPGAIALLGMGGLVASRRRRA
ncbi:MAG: hypothetical protein ACYTF7_07960 [Planctomycetota bacterium]|jgi:MYXO-CTERM domain-containing protein